MKKFLVPLVLILFSLASFAQTTTDANGNKVYNGSSVAIFTRMHCYEIRPDGSFKNTVTDEMAEEIRVGMNVMATTAAQNQGIQVVNRDNSTFKAAQKWIEESKYEDYLDGISARAKKIGATHILIQDISYYTYTTGERYSCFEVVTNAICVQTNVASKVCRRYYSGMNGSGISPSEMVKQEKESLRSYLMSAFPVFFVLQSSKGKTASLAAASIFGMDDTDEVYFYDWKNIPLMQHGRPTNFSKMKLIAKGTNPKLVNGLLQVKLDNAVSPSNSLVIKLGDILHSEINTYYHVPMAVADFKIKGNTVDDYCKAEINNAIYNAIYNLDVINLIENNDLEYVKSERELQKTEDFIDGSVIEQFKASGAMYLLALTEFSQSNKIVNFKMDLINIENGSVEKSYPVKCHISNVDEVVDYQMSKVFVSPSAIGSVSNKQIVVYPTLPLASKLGESFNILYNKPITNPVNGSVIYNRVEVATGRLTEWNCQEYVITIDNIHDKEDFSTISSNKENGLFYLQKNVEEPENPLKDNSFHPTSARK